MFAAGPNWLSDFCSVLTAGLGRDMLLSNLRAALELIDHHTAVPHQPTTQRQWGVLVPGKGSHTWSSSCRVLENEVDGQA
ncbi:uncharacterized protein [Apostichopus japonicus]|uniref:uncharacterized protein isoform X2 n=1 Tax=Stichopus japonicus TaxID=307972 RepID=UPI003AB47898